MPSHSLAGLNGCGKAPCSQALVSAGPTAWLFVLCQQLLTLLSDHAPLAFAGASMVQPFTGSPHFPRRSPLGEGVWGAALPSA